MPCPPSRDGCGGPRPRGTADGCDGIMRSRAVASRPVRVRVAFRGGRHEESEQVAITRPLAAGGPTTGEPERRRVRGHDGALGYVEVHTVVKTVERWTGDLDDVDPLRVATKTINGLYDGATADELDRLTIHTAADLIGEEIGRASCRGRGT